MKSSQVGDRHLASIEDDWLMQAPVVALIKHACPSAIAGRVRAVVVDPVYLVARWARAHVGKKGSEVVAPLVAHGNTSTAPIAKARVILVVAASAHVAPRFIFAAATRAWFVAVLSRTLARGLTVKAAAASRLSRQQVSKSDVLDGAAVAQAFHAARSPAEWCDISDHDKPVESRAIVAATMRHDAIIPRLPRWCMCPSA